MMMRNLKGKMGNYKFLRRLEAFIKKALNYEIGIKHAKIINLRTQLLRKFRLPLQKSPHKQRGDSSCFNNLGDQEAKRTATGQRVDDEEGKIASHSRN